MIRPLLFLLYLCIALPSWAASQQLSELAQVDLLTYSQLSSNRMITPHVKMTGGQYQFQIEFFNDTAEREWVFVPANSVFNQVNIELFEIRHTQNRFARIEKIAVFSGQTGSAQVPSFAYNHGLAITLKPDTQYQLYVDFDSPYFSSRPQFTLQPKSEFAHQVTTSNVIILLCLGAILLLVAYNLLIGFSVADSSFFYYSLYMLANFIGWGAVFNVFLQHFALHSLWLHNVPFFFNVIFSLLFSIKFLSLKTLHPLLTKMMYGLIATSLLLMFSQLIAPGWVFTIATFMVGICLNFAIYAGISRWKDGYRPARYFVFGYALIYLSGIVILPGNLGFGDIIEHSEIFTLLCITGDAILLALALADRISLMREEAAQAQTLRIEAERRMREEEERSTKRLHEANDMLEQSLKVSRQANEQKDQFIMAASHELRTPLQSVVGFLDQIDLEPDPVKRQELKDYMIQGSARLSEQIEHLVTMAELGQGKLKALNKTFDLKALMAKIESDVRRARQVHGNKVVVKCAENLPPAFEGDLNLTGRLLAPIIENACKFNRGELPVVVSIEVSEQGLLIKVTDHGKGLSKIAQERLFSAFEQADSGFSREYEGLGLGLAISSQIADLLSAKVDFKTSLNRGTTFMISLPLIFQQNQKLSSSVLHLKPFKILIVEDNPVNAGVLKAYLSKLGFKFHWVTNGQLAVEAMQNPDQDYDLILMDLQMPVMDGFDATEVIRTFSDTPIIAVSANSEYEARKRCDELQMNGFLAKPLGLQDLKIMLNEWFET